MVLAKTLARILLVTLLASFLSPAFAWQMHATHEELAHSLSVPADHHHDHDQRHDHADPHSLLGHLFSHLPSLPSGCVETAPATGGLVNLVIAAVRIAPWLPDPPFRPPRRELLAS